MGFGTGLNALLTCIEADKYHREVHYQSIENFPLSGEIINQLNFQDYCHPENENTFRLIHEVPWNKEIQITNHFFLTKLQADIQEIELKPEFFNLIYYDAFGPGVQPELWTESIFSRIAAGMKANGIFITYSAKGSVRRALKSSGLTVEKLQGPPGKREITRAIKKQPAGFSV